MVTDKVLFYEGRWYFLSNFSSFMVRWRDVDWMTSEHAYQAAAFDDPDIIEAIRNARSSHDAKKIARANANKKISDWHQINLVIMEEIVRAKLEQHPYIQKKLLETANMKIVEDSPKDSFWGRGADWKGENNLGKIWMKLREELKARRGQANNE